MAKKISIYLFLLVFISGCSGSDLEIVLEDYLPIPKSEQRFCSQQNGAGKNFFAYRDLSTGDYRCSNYFRDNRGYVRYNSDKNPLVVGAADGFVPLNKNLGKTLKFVYHKDKRIFVEDPRTFRNVNGSDLYTLDKKAVYFNLKVLKGANPYSFEFIDGVYAKDESKVFLAENIIKMADPDSFKILDGTLQQRYASDHNNLYYQGNLVEGVDLATVRVVNNDYIADVEHFYFKGKRVEDSDSNSFEWFLSPDDYQFDKKNVYYKNLKIPGSDGGTFEKVSDDYVKDQNQVYFYGKIVEGADPLTFEVEENGYFAKDKNRLYVGVNARDKKSEIRNFIEAFLRQSGIEVNKKGGEVRLIIDLIGDSNFCYSDDIAVTIESGCVARKEAEKFVELERNLIERFGIEKLTAFYRESSDDGAKLMKVFEDHEYVNEDIILKMSPDGRYIVLDQAHTLGVFSVNTEGRVIDMSNGEEFPIYNEMDKDLCFNGDLEEENISHCEELAKSRHLDLSKKYLLSNDFDKGKGFYQDEIDYGDGVVLKAMRFRDPSITEYESYLVSLNLLHKPSGTEVIVETMVHGYEDWFDSRLGFYGNEDMQGLIYLSKFKSGCFIGMQHNLISQDKLDHALASLYNRIGMQEYEQQNYIEAIAAFKKGIDKDREGQLHFNLACTYSLEGDFDEAIAALGRAINLNPEKFKEKAKSDSDFDGLRNLVEFKELIK